MIEELEKRTRAYFDAQEDSKLTETHLDYAVAQVESGEPLAAIARSIASDLGKPISREMLSKYLHETFSDAKPRLEAARPTMGEALAEDSLSIVDAPMQDKTDVARAGLRARTRENLAKMFNPAFQPNKLNGGTTINIGELHLDALRTLNARDKALAPNSEIELNARITGTRLINVSQNDTPATVAESRVTGAGS